MLSCPECVAEGFPFEGWGPGVQEATRGRCVVFAKRSQSVRKASASVRKRSQAFAAGRTCRRDERDENRRET